MKHKVVINDCYGGFGLSALATAKLYQCTHPEADVFFYKENRDFSDFHNVMSTYTKCPPEDADTVTVKDFGDKYTCPSHGDKSISDSVIYFCDYPRHDKNLVRLVEELGDKANGDFAQLKVIEIDGNRYNINEYDGLESICLPEHMHWIVIPEE